MGGCGRVGKIGRGEEERVGTTGANEEERRKQSSGASPAGTAVDDDRDDAPANTRWQGMLKKACSPSEKPVGADSGKTIPNTRSEENEKRRTREESATQQRAGAIDP